MIFQVMLAFLKVEVCLKIKWLLLVYKVSLVETSNDNVMHANNG